MIKDRINHLKKDLLNEKLSMEQLFQKHVVDIPTYFFSEILNDTAKEYKIRELVANALEVHINEVLVMGSAKLGYSLSPKKTYRDFDHIYNQTRAKKDKSDLDIAIISNDYFSDVSIKLYQFSNSYRTKWKANEYYNGAKLRDFDVPINHKLFEYHIKGWFRPDFKPIGFEFCINKTFEELKKEILHLTGRKTGLAIYKNWFYFKSYHIENLNRLQSSMKTEIL